jgi:uncharacterized protein (DUF58 family)
MNTPAVAGAGADAGLGVVASLQELIALRAQAALPERRSARVVAAPGSHLAPRQSRGMEFAEARPYQSGDDVRSLDWRQTARRGRPYTKLFQEEHERPVQLLVDLGASMRFGSRVAFKSVLAARVAALLAWRAVAAGDRVGALICAGGEMRVLPAQGRTPGLLTLLADLAAASAAPPAASGLVWRAPLQALARAVRPGSQLVILSDFAMLDADVERQLGALARSAELVLVQVYDRLEAEAPPPGLYRVSDGQHSRTLDLRTEAARSAYGAAFAERSLRLQALARRSGARLLPLATHDAPESVLRALQAPGSGWRLPATREVA